MIRLVLRSAFLGLGLLFIGAPVLLAPAQEKLDPGKEKAFLGGMKDKLDGRENGRLSELRVGNKDVGDEDPKFNHDVLAKAARYYVYRVTEPRFWGSGDDEKEGGKGPTTSMNDLVKDAAAQLLITDIRRRTPLKPTQQKYLVEIGKEMLACLREVFTRNSELIVRVNAARILALVAETGQEQAADLLLALVENHKEHDAVKLYALRGLHELLAAGTPDKSVFKDDKKEVKCIQAAQAFLTRKVDLPAEPGDKASEEDQTRYKQELAAFNFVRREAVRALGSSRYATVPKSTDDAGRTALWLLRVARKQGGLTPPPSLSEQVEAAIGACQLQPGKDLQLEVVAYHTGHVIVEFANEYAQQKGGNAGDGLPWKLYSTKLGLALDELQAHAKGNKYVEDMLKRSRDVLKPIEVGKDPNATTLKDWLDQDANKRKSNPVYAGVADSGVEKE